jgi:activator of HSP90 ATPase
MKDYKKYFVIKAAPEEIYQSITNKKSIELWTGERAVMTEEVNSEFSLWDDSITGKNLEFEINKKVVQEWYFGDQKEPSIVTIKLHAHKKGTSLELVHTNIPDDDYDDFVEGWEESYMAGIKEFVEDDGKDD